PFESELRKLSSTRITMGDEDENNPWPVAYCYCISGRGVDPGRLCAGAAVRRTGKRLQPAQPAAIGRDFATASAHHAAAGSDQGGGEQRSAVPVGQLADASVGGAADRQNGPDSC